MLDEKKDISALILEEITKCKNKEIILDDLLGVGRNVVFYLKKYRQLKLKMENKEINDISTQVITDKIEDKIKELLDMNTMEHYYDNTGVDSINLVFPNE